MTGNAPDLPRTTEALRQLADLEAIFGPHDERLRTCLAASFWLLLERFGDDDWHAAPEAPLRRGPPPRAARKPATLDAARS